MKFDQILQNLIPLSTITKKTTLYNHRIIFLIRNFIHPRLFVIENNNTGYELLNEDQVKHFKLLKKRYRSLILGPLFILLSQKK